MIGRWLLSVFLVLWAPAVLGGEMLSAGQPDEADIRRYADQGYKTVIDLRGVNEDRGMDDEAAVVADAGMTYVSFPIVGLPAVSFDNAEKLSALLAEVDAPVVLHCGSGNRVGALLALRASLKGASDEEAMATGKEFGMTSLTGHIEQLLQHIQESGN